MKNIETYSAGRRALWLVVLVLICGVIAMPPAARAADKIEKAGDVLQFVIPALAYGGTFYAKDEDGRLQFYKSFLTSFVVTRGLKYAVDKKRPNGGDKSFPSGHTSAAFQGAAFIHKRYGFKYAVPAYIGASFVGYSRLESDNHFIEDVMAGAAVGVIAGFYFTEPYSGLVVSPTAYNGSYGITVSRTW